MVWSCALALGLVWCLLTQSSFFSLWLVLALPGLGLPSMEWKRALPWILVGWLWGMALQFIHESRQRPGQNDTTTEWVCIRPTFLPPVDSEGKKLAVKGIWEGVDARGMRFRCWLKGDSLDRLSMRTALIKVTPIRPSDLVSTFDFAAYLQSQGVVMHTEVLTWGAVVQESLMDQGLLRLSTAWRAVLHKKFRGEGAPLIWGVFGGDKSALTGAHRSSFQQLGIAHLLAVSGYHVGLMSALFLFSLKAQNRRLKRLSGLGVFVAFVFVAACGNPVSGLRSAGMLMWVWLDVMMGKKAQPWEAFGVVAVLTASLDVQQPHMLGTQLSFVATASLLSLRGKGIWWRVPVRAQMGTMALTTRAFDAFPLLFYPANVIAGPVMLILGMCCMGTIVGLPWVGEVADSFAATVLRWTQEIASRFPMTLPQRGLSGTIGLCLVVPISLHWLIKRIACPARRSALWLSVCLTAGLACLILTWVGDGGDQLHWHLLKGKPGAWLVTDGYGSQAWSTAAQKDGCLRAAGALSLEGPVNWCGWNDPSAVQNQQWTQPPFAVWVHRNAFNARTRSVHSLDSLSSISAGW